MEIIRPCAKEYLANSFRSRVHVMSRVIFNFVISAAGIITSVRARPSWMTNERYRAVNINSN